MSATANRLHDERVKVAEAMLTYVATDDQRRLRVVPEVRRG